MCKLYYHMAEESTYNDCLYFSSNALARMLTRMADEEFGKLGLSPSHAFLLMSVIDKPSIQPGKLSDELQLSPSTVTRLVEKMEYRGYLERHSEGRAAHVHPTQQCLDLDDELHKAWQSLINRYKNILGDRYSKVLTEMTFTALEKLEE